MKQSLIISIGDLFIVLLYGASLCYTHFFIIPLPVTIQLVASGLLAFILGAVGPEVEDLVEWVLFFSLGVFVAALSPQIFLYFETETYSLNSILQTAQQTLPYCLQLLSPWTLMIPFGYVFFKISHYKHYRHARFF